MAANRYDPTELDPYVRKYAEQEGLDLGIARAFLRAEGYGRYNPEGGGWGARGPYQMRQIAYNDLVKEGRMPPLDDPDKLFDPDFGTLAGIKYIKLLHERHGGDIPRMQRNFRGPVSDPAWYQRFGGDYMGPQEDEVSAGQGGQSGLMNMAGMVPGLDAAMKWIMAGQGNNDPIWEQMSKEAESQLTGAEQDLEAAAQGISPEAIQQRIGELRPQGEVGADVVERLFSNLATGLTGNPLFAQAAVSTQMQRDLARRNEIVNQNIQTYQRAATKFEQAGNYVQAMKMRRLELAERKQQDQLTVKAKLAEEGMQQFAETQRKMLDLGVSISPDGTMSLSKASTKLDLGVALDANEWQTHMNNNAKLLQEAAQVKDKGTREALMARAQANHIALATTPRRGMTTSQYMEQIKAYMPDFPPAAQAQAFEEGLEANRKVFSDQEQVEALLAPPKPLEQQKPYYRETYGDATSGTKPIKPNVSPPPVSDLKGDDVSLMKEVIKPERVWGTLKSMVTDGNPEAIDKMARDLRLTLAIMKELSRSAAEEAKAKLKAEESK